MASSDIGVARAVFIAPLLTRDTLAPSIRREDATSFTKTLLRALNRCTNADVKVCKNFVIRYILPSASRTRAFTRYLLALAQASAAPEGQANRKTASDAFEGLQEASGGRPQQQPHSSYRRLHLLYIVHDVLAFVALVLTKDSPHARDHPINPAAIENLHATVPILVQLAVCSDNKISAAAKQVQDAVEDLLASWKKHDMLPATITDSLPNAIQSASKMDIPSLLSHFADLEAQAALAVQRAQSEAMKWTIPQTHHMPYDPSAPWYDLPAANGLYQKRTRGYPLVSSSLPEGGYRLRNAGRQADPAMQAEVESLLKEAKRCFDKYTDPAEVEDIDPLGNIVWKESTGRKRRNCWGWSYDGIEQRQKILQDSRW